MPASERVDALDVLRGFALLGILLVNIELFRGPALYELLAGEEVAGTPAEEIVSFTVGWLAGGKFLSSFAILFGVGAAVIAGRAVARGHAARGLLAKRYAWLLVFGLVHMLLLFAGDILFVYGIAGLLLLPFALARVRTLLWWAGGILVVYLVLVVGFTALGAAVESAAPQPADDPVTAAVEGFFAERAEQAVAAYTEGGLGDQLQARAWEALLVQSGQILLAPWVLALFLLGFAVGKAGILADLHGHRRLLRRIALVALPVGLVANVPVGFAGALGGAAVGPDPEVGGLALLGATLGQIAGAPLLAVGYLSGLALLCLRPGVLARLAPLRDAGRMALSGYVLQSVLATGLFTGFGLSTGFSLYGQVDGVQALGVVAGIWVVLLVVTTLWQRRLGRGPLERLWRRLTYGRDRPAAAGPAQH